MCKISSAIRSASTRDGTVLLDVQHGRILSLNSIGSRVFEMLRGGLDENQIAGEISKGFGADADQVRSDVRDFIRTLEGHNVLEAS